MGNDRVLFLEESMAQKYKKIICCKCKRDTGYTEEIIVKGNIKEDKKCPHCGTVVITAEVDYC